MKHAFNPDLYAIVDLSIPASMSLERVALAIEGGVSLIQLRGKLATPGDLVRDARRLLPLCRREGIPLLINDRPDVAAAAGADGVHLGQDDVPAAAIRRLHPEWIIGQSVHDRAELDLAMSSGMDYVASGSLYPTGTKADAVPLDHRLFRDLCAASKVPLIGIGGITVENAAEVKGLGAAGVAVIGGLWSAEDVRGRAAAYRLAVRSVPRG